MLLPQVRPPTALQPIRTLILEDQAADADLILMQLRQSGFIPDWQRVETAQDFDQVLCGNWDVILADYALPHFNALRALEMVHQCGRDIPFIVVTGDAGEEQAVECMRQGAEDYVLKDRMARLGEAVRRAIQNRQTREEKRQAEAALRESEGQFRAIVESLPLPLAISRLSDGKVLYVNPFIRDVIAKWPAELERPTEFYKNPAERQALFAERKEKGLIRNREAQMLRPDGEYSTMLLSMSLITYKGEQAALIETQDMSAMHEAMALAAIVQTSDDAIISFAMDGTIMSWNAGAEHMLGYAASEVIGKHFTTLFSDPDGPEVREIREKLEAGESFSRWEAVRTRKDGSKVDVSISLFFVRDTNGTPVRVSAIERDITERKKSERALLELNEALEHQHRELLAIHELGRTLAATLDMREIYHTIYREVGQKLLHVPHLTVALYNEAMQLITCDFAIVDGTEIDASELPAITFGEGVTSDTIRERTPRIVDMEALYQKLAASGRVLMVGNDDERMPKSGLYVPMISGDRVIGVMNAQSYEADAFRDTDMELLGTLANYAGIALENARLYAALLSYTDLLEERVAVRTDELNRAKEHLEAIFNHTGDALALVDINGTIERTNRAFDELFGFDDQPPLGSSIIACIRAEHASELAAALERVVIDHKRVSLETLAQRQDESLFDADIRLAPLMEYSAERFAVICSLRDISPHKLAQAELRKALDKERELGEMRARFMAMVSHEFRTPLTTIRLATDLLKSMNHRLTEEKRTAQLNKVQQEVKGMNDLLEEILTVSRAEQIGIDLHPEPHNLEEFCWKIIGKMELIAGKPRINFKVSGNPETFNIDPHLMQQALGNLISNALKYSPPDSNVEVDLACEADHAALKVRDYGIGIPNADQQHLFEAFYRAKNVGSVPGTGLGLRIVKQAVEAHGGTIALHSVVGEGTTFSIVLPRHQVQ